MSVIRLTLRGYLYRSGHGASGGQACYRSPLYGWRPRGLRRDHGPVANHRPHGERIWLGSCLLRRLSPCFDLWLKLQHADNEKTRWLPAGFSLSVGMW